MTPKGIKRKGFKRKAFRIARKIAPKAQKGTKIKRKTKPLGKLLKKADQLFSLSIRARDKHCQFPNCQSTKGLQNSHYIGRAIKSTRFDPDNCIALCYFHHFRSKDLGFEYQKQTQEKHGFDGQYTLFQRRLLGEEGYSALMRRSKESLKLTREFLEAKILELKQ